MRRLVENLAVGCALFGGFVLLAIVVLTTVSIVGRSLISFGLTPVSGDFELVEIGTGIAVFAALPLCHLRRGHATVDLLANVGGASFNRLFDMLIDSLILVLGLVITWQIWLGMLDKMLYLETTFILQIPLWWSYLVCALLASVFCILAVFRAGESLVTLVGRSR